MANQKRPSTIALLAILAPEGLRAVGPTCSAAKPPIINTLLLGMAKYLSKTGNHLMILGL